jgi:hypothetical protein
LPYPRRFGCCLRRCGRVSRARGYHEAGNYAAPDAIGCHLFDDWFDLIEAGIRDRVREFIEEMIRGELDAVLSRLRYGGRRGRYRDSWPRHGRRTRTLTETFGETKIAVPVPARISHGWSR